MTENHRNPRDPRPERPGPGPQRPRPPDPGRRRWPPWRWPAAGHVLPLPRPDHHRRRPGGRPPGARSCKVYGSVEKILVEDNQEVKAGDLLVQLDARDLQSRVDQAKAALEPGHGPGSRAPGPTTTRPRSPWNRPRAPTCRWPRPTWTPARPPWTRPGPTCSGPSPWPSARRSPPRSSTTSGPRPTWPRASGTPPSGAWRGVRQEAEIRQADTRLPGGQGRPGQGRGGGGPGQPGGPQAAAGLHPDRRPGGRRGHPQDRRAGPDHPAGPGPADPGAAARRPGSPPTSRRPS